MRNPQKTENISQEELDGKVIWGEFVNIDNRKEYTDVYAENIRRAKESANE